MIAMSLTPAVDGLAKVLAQDYSPFFVAFVRYLSAGLLALLLARLMGRRIHIAKKHRVGQCVRTAVLAAAMTSLIGSLSLVPLAMAAGGFLIAPVVAMLICVFVFGEQLTGPRVLGCCLSLVGAVLIVRPETGLEPGALLALLGGALLGLYFAITRGVRDDSEVLSALAVQCLLASLLLAPFAFIHGIPPYSGILIPCVVGLGALSATAHFLTVAAYRKSDAGVLSPFMYFNLIAALGVGYLCFHEVPTLASLFGLMAIAAGGLVTLVPVDRLRLRVAGFRA